MDNRFFFLKHFWMLATIKPTPVTSSISHQEIPHLWCHRTSSSNSIRLENSNDQRESETICQNSNDQREPEIVCQNSPESSHEMDSENLKSTLG
jgi:hypothetical protein